MTNEIGHYYNDKIAYVYKHIKEIHITLVVLTKDYFPKSEYERKSTKLRF